ncbi:ABC transporter substrate-binding protein [Paenibacillus oceani]|uniref:Extracellular solute-binding protein n=1 Tax=Paenibacillus oceani TaxID=2772510 RepID=A0A927C9Q8_9BACL|nr:extracellular solute-binding protein [Paenibacillus oceani]MBD2862311.1 extracellular solute-binding protein [Paenibacillus oceani]
MAGSIVLIAGCAGGEEASNTVGNNADLPQASDEYSGGPVELLVKDQNAALTESEFEKIARQVKVKYPDISLKMTKDPIDTLLAAGTVPDLVTVSNPSLGTYLDIDYPEDLNPMIKRFKVDLNRIDPTVLETLKQYGKDGGIYGIPFGMNYGAMVYNKDIFDKFGVPYPTDSITWEQFLDLSKRLTRMDGEVQYIGGTPDRIMNLLKQNGISNMDAKDEKAILTTEKHQYVFSYMKELFEIPGLVNDKVHLPTNVNSNTIAMKSNWIASFAAFFTKNPPEYDWDLTAYPVFKDKQTGNPVDFHMMTVSKTSKHKEAAYRVLLTMMSEEMQLALSKSGRLSILNDPNVKLTYASDSKVFEGKNLKAVLSVPPSPLPDYSTWTPAVKPFIDSALKDIAYNKSDINTALREAEEKANRKIEEERAMKGIK